MDVRVGTLPHACAAAYLAGDSPLSHVYAHEVPLSSDFNRNSNMSTDDRNSEDQISRKCVSRFTSVYMRAYRQHIWRRYLKHFFQPSATIASKKERKLCSRFHIRTELTNN